MEYSVSYEKAIGLITAAVRPAGKEEVSLETCFSRVLAEYVTSADNVPPFDRSPYDGYALRAEDVQGATHDNPVTLEILEEIPAGGVPHFQITTGTAAKILTGAPIPEGADAVVMFEKTKFTHSQVTLFHPLKPGENIVRMGEDVVKGAVLAEQGQEIDAGLMGTLASQNKQAVQVYQKPKIGLISTGSELVQTGGALASGKIYDSNRYTLTGALQRLGCIPVSYGIAGDSVSAIAELLGQALRECDGVILTGGVSVGDYDLTPAAMETVGVETLFRGCDIKPGMACAYGVKDGKPVCALSGNPASSFTNFQLIARPALLKLCGREDYLPREIILTLANGFDKKSPVTRILRGKLDLSHGTANMELPKDQGNVVLSSTIGWNVMAIVPAGTGKLDAGTQLKGFML